MFRFFRWFTFGPAKVGVSKRGVRPIKMGCVSKSQGRGVRVSIPTGIKGLSFSLGGSASADNPPPCYVPVYPGSSSSP